MTIGERVEALRIERGLSQEQLAEHLDVHQTTISAVERGANLPSVPLLIRMQNFFGSPLLDITNEQPEPVHA